MYHEKHPLTQNSQIIGQFVFPGVVINPAVVHASVGERRGCYFQTPAFLVDRDVLIVVRRENITVLIPDYVGRGNPNDGAVKRTRVVDYNRRLLVEIRFINVCRN